MFLNQFKHFGRARVYLFLALALLLFLPIVATVIDDSYLISFSSRILIYALAAVSLDLILGYGGMVSLGHAAFLGIGAYSVGILTYHAQEGSFLGVGIAGSDSVLVTISVAIVISALMAAVIGALSLRTSGVYFIMITLAFAQMFYYLFVSLEAYGGDDGLSLWTRNTLGPVDLSNDIHFYYLSLALLLLFLFFAHRLVHSRFGRVIRGARENELRMQALGYPTYRYKLVCFIISGAGTGLAGALLANQNEFVSPGMMHWTQSGEILIMVLLGGMGTLFGPVLGAMTLLVLEEILAAYTEHWMVFLGPFLIIMVLFAKRGLYGLLIGARKS